MIILSETINLLISEVLGKFDLGLFKRLSAGNVRPQTKEEEEDFVWMKKSHPEIAYAKKTLPLLGEGSSRIVFALSGDKALKIATNKMGTAQNLAEINIGTKARNVPMITHVYDYGDNGNWVITELVKPFGDMKELGTHLGLDVAYTGQFINVINAYMENPNRTVDQFIQDIELALKQERTGYFRYYPIPVWQNYMNQLKGNAKAKAFLKGMASLVKIHDLSSEEMIADHFGRNMAGEIKLLDFGGTMEVLDAHYRKNVGSSN